MFGIIPPVLKFVKRENCFYAFMYLIYPRSPNFSVMYLASLNMMRNVLDSTLCSACNFYRTEGAHHDVRSASPNVPEGNASFEKRRLTVPFFVASAAKIDATLFFEKIACIKARCS